MVTAVGPDAQRFDSTAQARRGRAVCASRSAVPFGGRPGGDFRGPRPPGAGQGDRGARSVIDLASATHELGLSRSTTYRYLTAMVKHGLLVHTPGHAYTLVRRRQRRPGRGTRSAAQSLSNG